MKFILEIGCNGSAFADAEFYPEIARLLSQTAENIMNGVLLAVDHEGESRTLIDTNGNGCGFYRFAD